MKHYNIGEYLHRPLHRVVFYLEMANKHRLPIVEKLAQTLACNSVNVVVFCEREISFTYEGCDNILYIDNSEEIRKAKESLLSHKVSVNAVECFSSSTQQGLLHSNQLRHQVVSELLLKEQPELFILWSGNFAYQKGTLDALRGYNGQVQSLFMEVAWFSQREFIYFDKLGVNAKSSIKSQTIENLTPLQEMVFELWHNNYKRKRLSKETSIPVKGRIFIPLQVDTDTSIQQNSPFKSMQEFIRFLENWIPVGYEVVLKAHPKAKYDYILGSVRSDFKIVYSGAIDDCIDEASVVVGINSTVLLEAALLDKKVISFGDGIFKGQNVIAQVDINNIRHTFDYIIEQTRNAEHIKAYFYELVYEKQVSLQSLAENDVAHLFSRAPFNEYSILDKFENKKQKILIDEGKVMIKIGHSKIAKTASIDVDRKGTVTIGNNCEVRHHAVLEVSGKYNGSITIGNSCVIGVGNWLQGSGEIIIHDNVIIGPYAAIVSTNHQYEDLSIPISKQPLTTGKVEIEEGVWIGAHCTIVQNVKIGKNAIIAANSFVNKNVPENAIVGGTPAKTLKMRT